MEVYLEALLTLDHSEGSRQSPSDLIRTSFFWWSITRIWRTWIGTRGFGTPGHLLSWSLKVWIRRPHDEVFGIVIQWWQSSWVLYVAWDCNSVCDNADNLEGDMGICSNDSKPELVLCSQTASLQWRSYLVRMMANPAFNRLYPLISSWCDCFVAEA